jgi:shikimate kinase
MVTSHIYLVGFMGIGKTTIARKLAQTLQIPFIDSDKAISEQTGFTISQLFDQFGEEHFRKLEADFIRSLSDEKPKVIATGGGLPCYFDNMQYMNTHGITVYLSATPAFIFSRLKQSKTPRPLLLKHTHTHLPQVIADMLQYREPYYLLSKVKIEMPEKSVQTAVNTIINSILKQ